MSGVIGVIEVADLTGVSGVIDAEQYGQDTQSAWPPFPLSRQNGTELVRGASN